jgi:hypothetical protein
MAITVQQAILTLEELKTNQQQIRNATEQLYESAHGAALCILNATLVDISNNIVELQDRINRSILAEPLETGEHSENSNQPT